MTENQQTRVIPDLPSPTLSEFDQAIATLKTQHRYQGTDTTAFYGDLRDLLYGKRAKVIQVQP